MNARLQNTTPYTPAPLDNLIGSDVNAFYQPDATADLIIGNFNEGNKSYLIAIVSKPNKSEATLFYLLETQNMGIRHTPQTANRKSRTVQSWCYMEVYVAVKNEDWDESPEMIRETANRLKAQYKSVYGKELNAPLEALVVSALIGSNFMQPNIQN